ncbi:hypothetical protein MLD38_022034 [Melastoma candidum]|uniref:Uncharacterized protein n=1 Tax=Melastoma candidum TaxID=119954 RepID=A0ACB9QHZ7_9MYRT|nr:hypothetical protein MLD38_022034 [Melastoma candidum]
MALSTMSSPVMHISIPGERLYQVNIPTRMEADVAVAQVRDAGVSYLSSDSMRARPTSHIDGNNNTRVAFELLRRPETQEVVAELVSDPVVCSTICEKLQGMLNFGKIVQYVRGIKLTSCLNPRDGPLLIEDHETSSLGNQTSWWVSMFNMVVEAVSSVWNGLVDLFASAIPKIQAAFAKVSGASGDSNSVETAVIIIGLVVLVMAVIIVGTIVKL